MLIAEGFDLREARFSAGDLPQSGMSPGTVALHGDLLVGFGALPAIGLFLVVAVAAFRGTHGITRPKLALGWVATAQVVSLLAALTLASG